VRCQKINIWPQKKTSALCIFIAEISALVLPDFLYFCCRLFCSFTAIFSVLYAAASIGKPPPQPPDRSGSLLRSIQGHLQVTRNWLHRLVRITVNSQNWVCTEFAWVTGE